MKRSLPQCLLILVATTPHWDLRIEQLLICAVASFPKREKAAPIELFLIWSTKLRLKGTFAACLLLLKAQCTSYWGSYTSLTSVPNQTLWKNRKVVTINSLQLVMLKILLYVLSSSCASAIAGFPHSKNNITVCLHVKHSNSAMLPWLGAIVKEISYYT